MTTDVSYLLPVSSGKTQKIINSVATTIPSNRYYGLGIPFPTKKPGFLEKMTYSNSEAGNTQNKPKNLAIPDSKEITKDNQDCVKEFRNHFKQLSRQPTRQFKHQNENNYNS